MSEVPLHPAPKTASHKTLNLKPQILRNPAPMFACSSCVDLGSPKIQYLSEHTYIDINAFIALLLYDFFKLRCRVEPETLNVCSGFEP